MTGLELYIELENALKLVFTGLRKNRKRFKAGSHRYA